MSSRDQLTKNKIEVKIFVRLPHTLLRAHVWFWNVVDFQRYRALVNPLSIVGVLDVQTALELQRLLNWNKTHSCYSSRYPRFLYNLLLSTSKCVEMSQGKYRESLSMHQADP